MRMCSPSRRKWCRAASNAESDVRHSYDRLGCGIVVAATASEFQHTRLDPMLHMKIAFVSSCSALVLAALSACDDGVHPPFSPTRVDVSPRTASLWVGDTVR